MTLMLSVTNCESTRMTSPSLISSLVTGSAGVPEARFGPFGPRSSGRLVFGRCNLRWWCGTQDYRAGLCLDVDLWPTFSGACLDVSARRPGSDFSIVRNFDFEMNRHQRIHWPSHDGDRDHQAAVIDDDR